MSQRVAVTIASVVIVGLLAALWLRPGEASDRPQGRPLSRGAPIAEAEPPASRSAASLPIIPRPYVDSAPSEPRRTVRFVDAKLNSPVSLVRVAAVDGPESRPARPRPMPDQSDETGRLTLRTTGCFVASATGFVDQFFAVTDDAPSEGADVALHHRAVLAGTVREPSGAPVPNVAMRITSGGHPYGVMWRTGDQLTSAELPPADSGRVSYVRTDANGRFETDALRPGDCHILLRDDALAIATRSQIMVPVTEGRNEVDLVVKPIFAYAVVARAVPFGADWGLVVTCPSAQDLGPARPSDGAALQADQTVRLKSRIENRVRDLVGTGTCDRIMVGLYVANGGGEAESGLLPATATLRCGQQRVSETPLKLFRVDGLASLEPGQVPCIDVTCCTNRVPLTIEFRNADGSPASHTPPFAVAMSRAPGLGIPVFRESQPGKSEVKVVVAPGRYEIQPYYAGEWLEPVSFSTTALTVLEGAPATPTTH